MLLCTRLFFTLFLVAGISQLTIHAQSFFLNQYTPAPGSTISLPAIAILSDGSVVTGGFSDEKAILIKTGPTGETDWALSWEGEGLPMVNDIFITPDGRILFSISSRDVSSGDHPAYFVKMNVNGSVIWSRQIDGVDYDPFIRKIVPLSDGFLLIGKFANSGTSAGPFAMKTDENGEFVWRRSHPLPNAQFDRALENSQGDIVIAGNIFPVLSFIGKLDPAPGGGFTNAYTTVEDDFLSAIREEEDGSYRVYGRMGTCPSVYHFSSDFQELFSTFRICLPDEFVSSTAHWAEGGNGMALGVTGQDQADFRAFYGKTDFEGNPLWGLRFSPESIPSEFLTAIASDVQGTVTGILGNGLSTSNTAAVFKTRSDGIQPDCCPETWDPERVPATSNLSGTPEIPEPTADNFSNDLYEMEFADLAIERVSLCPINLDMALMSQDTCPFSCIEIMLTSPTPGIDYSWIFEGAEPATFEGTMPGTICYGGQEGSFQVTLTADDCVFRTEDVVIESKPVEFPNVFTPNRDGVNDVFGPVSLCDIQEFEMKIYDRWGELVFETQDYSNLWDGTTDGKDALSDVYIWKSTYSAFENGILRTFKDDGDVTLLR